MIVQKKVYFCTGVHDKECVDSKLNMIKIETKYEIFS